MQRLRSQKCQRRDISHPTLVRLAKSGDDAHSGSLGGSSQTLQDERAGYKHILYL